MKRVVITVCLFLFSLGSWAQCAMCRTTVVNNVSNGDSTSLAAGLNTGILYLFFTPYILLGVIAFLWYRNSKFNVPKINIRSRING